MRRQGCSLREVLAQQAIGIFVRAALPRTLWIAEINLHFRVHRETFVLGHFQSAIPGQRAPQSRGQLANVLACAATTVAVSLLDTLTSIVKRE